MGVAIAGWRWSGGARDGLAGWLEAVATVAAFAAAVTAAWYAAGAFRLESGREARWLEGKQAAQAELVAAWFDMHVEDGSGPAHSNPLLDFASQPYPAVFIRNASDLPVTEVTVSYAAITWPAGDWQRTELGADRIGLVPPSATPQHRVLGAAVYGEWSRLVRAAESADEADPDLLVTVRFLDAAGRMWGRSPTGRLEALPVEAC